MKEKFNISESGKVNKFPEVYHKWGHDAKGAYSKMTMEEDVKNIVEGYEKYAGSDLIIKKTLGSTVTTLSKIDLEDTDNINKYR